MGKTVKPLNELKIKNLKPKDKEYSLADGNNLYIAVTPQNNKIWRFVYTHQITKKRQKKTIGSFPFVRLVEAREIARNYQALIAQKLDPFEYIEHKKKEQERNAETFQSFAYKWAEWKLSKGKFREDTKLKTMQRLENHLFPRFEGYKLNQFTITDSIEKLQDLERIMPDTLYRILGSLIEIMDLELVRSIQRCSKMSHTTNG